MSQIVAKSNNGSGLINNIESSPKCCSYETGTLIGAVNNVEPQANHVLNIPEIVINRCYSNQSLRIRDQEDELICEEECSALLQDNGEQDEQDGSTAVQDDIESHILNRTTSESNVLESSIDSELQFTSGNESQAQPVISQSRGTYIEGSSNMIDGLSTRDSRQTKRTRRKIKSKPKCSSVTAGHTPTNTVIGHSTAIGGPPRYTAIFLDSHQTPIDPLSTHAPHSTASNDVNSYMQQQYQYYQHRPLLTTNISQHHHHHHLRNSFLETANLQPNQPNDVDPNEIGTAAPVISVRTTTFCLSFRKWFPRPSLPFVICILALAGVACTLGGIVLGSTGLIEHSTQYLSAALLLIGIGVSLLVISGAIWRLSLPDDTDECPCFRHIESCRNCNSPYCNNHVLLSSFLYPEFQHRPPPPSYLTSLNECAAMGFLLHPANHVNLNNMRVNTPPPLYRSTSSLRSNGPYALNTHWHGLRTVVPVSVPVSNLPNSASNATLSDRRTRNTALDDSENQTQALTKEMNYLELD